MLKNQQSVEKVDFVEDGSLDLHSIFYTLQGEGPYAGLRSVFIRLAGCNLQCPGCDTEYTRGRRRLQVSQIMEEAWRSIPNDHLTSTKPLIVITGGEPFRQDLYHLVTTALSLGFSVQVETNGVLAPESGLATMVALGLRVVVSPKTSRINEAWGRYAKAFKYVLQEGNVMDHDLLPRQALLHKATPFVARPPEGYRGMIYVNPMDEKDEDRNKLNLALVAEAALKFGYVAGIQMHKLMGLE